jgi:hypothetical protein
LQNYLFSLIISSIMPPPKFLGIALLLLTFQYQTTRSLNELRAEIKRISANIDRLRSGTRSGISSHYLVASSLVAITQ